jgi:uroporphyrinogen-III decarboxylase
MVCLSCLRTVQCPAPLPSQSIRPCSDILTPLPALGVPFDIDDNKGPLIDNPIRSLDQARDRRGGEGSREGELPIMLFGIGKFGKP